MGSLMRLTSDGVCQDNCRFDCDLIIIITILLLLFIYLLLLLWSFLGMSKEMVLNLFSHINSFT